MKPEQVFEGLSGITLFVSGFDVAIIASRVAVEAVNLAAAAFAGMRRCSAGGWRNHAEIP
jgi:hypothetical protein